MSEETARADEPAMGVAGEWFRTTHWSVVLSAGRGGSLQAEAALEQLCRTYWYPLYGYVRRRGHSPHDAQDLTQAFFAKLVEKDYLLSVGREKGKFRSFLLAALNHFLSHERERTQTVKRGGGKVLVSLDEGIAEHLLATEPASKATPEAAFDKRWATTLVERAFAQVRNEFVSAGKGELFDQLQIFLSEESGSGAYAAAAAALRMTPNAVAVAVHRLRQRYREAVRAEVANTVATPQEIADEMRHLFAVLAN